jgi:hypothetical protein
MSCISLTPPGPEPMPELKNGYPRLWSSVCSASMLRISTNQNPQGVSVP